MVRGAGVTPQVNTLLTLIQNQVIHNGKNVSLKAKVIVICQVTTGVNQVPVTHKNQWATLLT